MFGFHDDCCRKTHFWPHDDCSRKTRAHHTLALLRPYGKFKVQTFKPITIKLIANVPWSSQKIELTVQFMVSNTWPTFLKMWDQMKNYTVGEFHGLSMTQAKSQQTLLFALPPHLLIKGFLLLMTLCVIVHHQNNEHPCTNIHMHTQQISAGFSVWLLPPSLLLLLPIPPFFFFASLAVWLQDASCCHNSTNVIIFTVSSSTTNCTTFVCILGLLMSFPTLLALMMTAALLFSSLWVRFRSAFCIS